MYRVGVDPAESEREPAELEYRPRRDTSGFTAIGWIMLVFGTGVIAAAVVAARGAPDASLLVLAAMAVVIVVLWGRARRAPHGIVLRAARGEVTVVDAGRPRACIAFARLDDVVVDGGTVAVYQNVDLTEIVKSDIERACIVLVPEAPSRPVSLTPMDVPHLDCVEWAAKIRIFLRAQGWVPRNERDLAPESVRPDDETE